VIDFHCHIDLFPDPPAVIEKADADGVYVLAVTTTPKSWNHLQRLIAGRRRIRAAVGLHPELVAERHGEVEELCAIASGTRYIGEIGIDGSPELLNSFELQNRVFGNILEGASRLGGKILSIHSRRAATQVLDSLEKYPRAGIPVLHWFSGTKTELNRAIRLGAWFSVGPAMLASNKGAQLAAAMPRSRILTESDGPFATIRSVPLTPNDMAGTEERLAEIWQIPLEEARGVIRENFRNLVKGAET